MKFYIKFLSVIAIGWFPLQLLHEAGHIISCKFNGGTVHKIAFHFNVFTETIREGSAHPVIDIWMGPIVGIILPLLLLLIPAKKDIKEILVLFCAVCLIGNGLYIGLGWLCDGGDGWELIRYKVNLFWLILFGLPATVAGLIMVMRIKEGDEALELQ
ncbi:MAG TPA: hypothetical protein DCZ94_19775 [Lentisphaeria bacterium]|nr:MAG: hypothetical protein A2X48_22390 [Lentisphaerae bacterium GWF2_49_21]HBC89185.1 hypothetical protein [Lentisphaeria bacterium]